MESPYDSKITHLAHELPGGCSAGVLACECTGRPARYSCWRRDAAATRSRDGCATRFMESPHDFDAVHWDHEPRTSRTVPPRRRCRRLVGRASLRFLCRQDAGSTLRFMESPHALLARIGKMNPPLTPHSAFRLRVRYRAVIRFKVKEEVSGVLTPKSRLWLDEETFRQELLEHVRSGLWLNYGVCTR
jgi:hypothetical protein